MRTISILFVGLLIGCSVKPNDGYTGLDFYTVSVKYGYPKEFTQNSDGTRLATSVMDVNGKTCTTWFTIDKKDKIISAIHKVRGDLSFSDGPCSK